MKSETPISENPKAAACPLLARVIDLVRTCGKSPAVLAEETGLSYYWVQSLRYNNKIDPSVTKVVKMYEHLTGKKLEVL